MDSIFLNTAAVLGITIFIAFVIQILKQPLIISYIIAGIAVGPMFLNILNKDQEYFHVFAEFGVIFLLFIIGLSLNFHFLKKIGKTAAVTGIGQVVFTSIIGFAILRTLGFGIEFSIYLAIAITFSSTIIILKLLDEKRDTESIYGRYTIGLMLVQDIIAILLIILLPALKTGGSLSASLILILIKSFFFFVLIYFSSRVVLKLLDRAAKSGEFLLIFTIAWCFLIAGIAEFIGLSPEVGAVVAGLCLGSSVYSAEITSRIKPIRDFFVVIFFIILGSEMNLQSLGDVIVPGVILSLFVLIGNPLVLYFLYRVMKFSRKVSLKAGLTAAQVSEFGFVFLFMVRSQGYFDEKLLPIFTFTALTTIFVSSYLIMYNDWIFDRFDVLFKYLKKDKYVVPEKDTEAYDVLVFGYHRLGWKICDVLSELKISYAVIDCDPLAIGKLKTRQIPHFFGDATDVEFLSELPLGKAKYIISTMPSTKDQITMIKYVRERHENPIIIANLSYSRFLDEMYEAGADYIMMPHLIAGEWFSKLFKNGDLNRSLLKQKVKEQKESLRLRHNLPNK